MNLTLMECSNLSGPLAFSPLPLRETEREGSSASHCKLQPRTLSLLLIPLFLSLSLVGFLVHVAWGGRGVGVGGGRGTFAPAN